MSTPQSHKTTVKDVPLTIHRNGKDEPERDFFAEETALAEKQRELEQEQRRLWQERIDADLARKAKLREQRDEHVENAANFRRLARESTEQPDVKRYLAWARDAEQAAAAIVIEGEEEKAAQEIETPRPHFGLSTTAGIWGLAVLALLSAMLFTAVGMSAAETDNDSAQRMINSVGLRIVTNFLPWSLALLVGGGTLRLLFPTMFAYWHNRIKSENSLVQDLNDSPAWLRVSFFCFAFGLPVWAFVELMQVIFG